MQAEAPGGSANRRNRCHSDPSGDALGRNGCRVGGKPRRGGGGTHCPGSASPTRGSGAYRRLGARCSRIRSSPGTAPSPARAVTCWRRGGADGRQVSLGIGGKEGEINAPTVYNAGLLSSQFWNGRKKTLEEQIDGPIQNPLEMGNDWGEVLIRLYDNPEYGMQFQALEPESGEPITRETVKRANRGLRPEPEHPQRALRPMAEGRRGSGDETDRTGARRLPPVQALRLLELPPGRGRWEVTCSRSSE